MHPYWVEFYDDTLGQLRLLFEILTARLALLAADSHKNHCQITKLIRTIGRVVRMIIDTHVWLYQRDMKARMLSDPDWRARVIAQLGGFSAIQRWRERWTAWHGKGIGADRRGPHNRQNAADTAAPRSSAHAEIPHSGTSHAGKLKTGPKQFCLAPMPQGFYTRLSRPRDEAPHRPYQSPPMRSPFAKLIPLTADEIIPRRSHTPHRRRDRQGESAPRRDDHTAPPPRPYPP